MTEGRAPVTVWVMTYQDGRYPGKTVISEMILTPRGWVPAIGEDGLEVLRYHDDRDEMRRILRFWGLSCQPRQPDDDPTVIERWA